MGDQVDSGGSCEFTDRLLWPICQKNNEGSEARRIAANIAKLPELRRRPQY
jgi:hypothetical protein